MSAVQAKMMLENVRNAFEERNKFVEVTVSKNKRFLASKIHKLKKILKMTSRFFYKHNVTASDISLEEWQNHQNSIEEQMQNYENELLEKKLSAKQNANNTTVNSLEHDQNIANENWENWDSCYLCAQSQFSMAPSEPSPLPASPASVCYVYMPGQIDPVPVRLRNARIPGGVMWIVYRPDLDICHRDNLYQVTSNQIAQAQRPIFV